MDAVVPLLTLAVVAFASVVVEHIARRHDLKKQARVANFLPYLMGGVLAFRVDSISVALFGSTHAVWIGASMLIAWVIAYIIGPTLLVAPELLSQYST